MCPWRTSRQSARTPGGRSCRLRGRRRRRHTGLPNPGSGGAGGNGGRGGNGGGGGGSGGGDLDNLPGAGGGGGSGHADAGATDPRLESGVNRGDGRAVITWRYDTTLALTVHTTRSPVGRPVIVTTEVTSAAGGTPTGPVVLLDGDTPLGSAPLTVGRAVLRAPALKPGSHAISARYEGDALHHPGSTPEPLLVTVGSGRPCQKGTHEGLLTGSAGYTSAPEAQGPVVRGPGRGPCR
ncbi:Ig-like domain-containing protein [Streptomyces narbonensis]|uniref:Ig-like domain-containing protein n=1 Tax=Streptomyces narbonensis TaxID=67333 RepID=A0ABV3CC50_9ACTN